MKRFLMISPYFVPMNYVGAKRALHLARHLPALGWSPAVVALPADIERDPELEPLVPDVPMWRGFRGGPLAWAEDAARRIRPGPPPEAWQYTAQVQRAARAARRHGPLGRLRRGIEDLVSYPFDRFTRYLPWAVGGALELLRRERCQAIYCNSGPPSALELGAALHRLTGRPLILDLRDPWSLEPNYRAGRSLLAQRVVEWEEAHYLTRAARVVLNTRSACEAYRVAYSGRVPESRFAALHNSFDPELYGPASRRRRGGPFTVVYYGHMRPTKNAGLFLEAFRRFVDAEALQPGAVKLITLGERTPADNAEIARLGLDGFCEEHAWMPFTRCRELLGRADVLLDLMGPLHYLQISGKFFDYLACGRPVLSVTASAEMDEILKRTRTGVRVRHDAGEVAAALSRMLAERGKAFRPNRKAVNEFTAQVAAERMASWLDEATR